MNTPIHNSPDAGSRNSSLTRVVKEKRDTAKGCLDRATEDLLQSVTACTTNGRKVLERSAATWTARAGLLQRVEASLNQRLSQPELTASEIAEDAAEIRLAYAKRGSKPARTGADGEKR